MKLRRRDLTARPELTPLIDVVFLLLVFFIFSMILMIRADVMDVRLPTVGSARAAEPGASITVAVRSGGELAVNGAAVDIEGLVAAVEAERAVTPDARLLLAVDEASTSKDLLAAVDRLATSGLGEFSILAQPGGAAQATPAVRPDTVGEPAAAGPPAP